MGPKWVQMGPNGATGRPRGATGRPRGATGRPGGPEGPGTAGNAVSGGPGPVPRAPTRDRTVSRYHHVPGTPPPVHHHHVHYDQGVRCTTVVLRGSPGFFRIQWSAHNTDLFKTAKTSETDLSKLTKTPYQSPWEMPKMAKISVFHGFS